MSKRLVVCMRWRPAEQGADPQSFASARAASIERMSALGGRLVLWHPEWLAIDFALSALQDAIDFMVDRPPPGFSMGFAYGPLTEMLDGGPLLAACLGPTLDAAMSLARMARSGEVLIEPGLVKASGGELLVRGARVATIGEHRVRGLKLDLAHPQRSLECENIARLRAAPWSGPEPALETAPGTLSLVRAGPGGGGSRFLQEHRARLAPGSLWFARFGSGQPQGALLHGLSSDAASRGGAPELSAVGRQTFESLLQGCGARPDAAAGLVAEWLTAREVAPVLYVEDVAELDADSLEVLARAALQHHLALVGVLDSGVALPAAFVGLPVHRRIVLPDLTFDQAVALVQHMTSDQLEAIWAERLATRGLPTPLGVTQSVVEALDSASFLWTDSGVVPRVPRDDMPEAHSAEALLRRRLHFVELSDRLELDALAVLGGDAEQAHVAGLLTLAGRSVSNLEASLSYLERVGWVKLGPRTTVSLTTRTHRAAIVSALSERRFRALHQAAAALLAESERPLGLASAALHAGLAGNVGKAALLARRAAASARAAGLEATARALESYADTGDLAALQQRGLTGGQADAQKDEVVDQDDQFIDAGLAPEAATAARVRSETLPAVAPPPSDEGASPIRVNVVSSNGGLAAPSYAGSMAAANADRAAGAVSGSPPLSPAYGQDKLQGPVVESEQISETDLEAMSADDIELEPAAGEPEGLTGTDLEAQVGAAPPEPGNSSRVSPTLRVAGVPSDSESLMPERAALALQRGDPVTLDELARQLRGEAHTLLADRLDAMACLVRGQVGQALRQLRDAKARAGRLSLSEQCRASLALSVAIAAAGRPNDALLEVLEGLSRARRAGDSRGERACAKFLAQLAERAGHPHIAEAWTAISVPRSESAE